MLTQQILGELLFQQNYQPTDYIADNINLQIATYILSTAWVKLLSLIFPYINFTVKFYANFLIII